MSEEPTLVSIKCRNISYFLWVTDIDHSSMRALLQITNGVDTWEGYIGVADKPHSNQQSESVYFKTLLECIRHIDTKKYEYELTTEKQNHLLFALKEYLDDGISALLAKCTLLPCASQIGMSKMLSSICDLLQRNDITLNSYKREVEKNREVLDRLAHEIRVYSDERETFQTSLVSKFCLVVNSKKDEIKRLCDEVSRLKKQLHEIDRTSQSSASLKMETASKPACQPFSAVSDEDTKSNDDDTRAKSKRGRNGRTLPRRGRKVMCCTAEAMSQMLAPSGMELSSSTLDIMLTQSQSSHGNNNCVSATPNEEMSDSGMENEESFSPALSSDNEKVTKKRSATQAIQNIIESDEEQSDKSDSIHRSSKKVKLTNKEANSSKSSSGCTGGAKKPKSVLRSMLASDSDDDPPSEDDLMNYM